MRFVGIYSTDVYFGDYCVPVKKSVDQNNDDKNNNNNKLFMKI